MHAADMIAVPNARVMVSVQAAPNSEPPPRRVAHVSPAYRRALLTMVLCTALWSTAGVATRLLDNASGYEIAFWRSLVCAIFVICVLAATHQGRWITEVRASGWPGLVSGVMWAVMFTCFMLALTRTTVANVLVVMAAAPLMAALLGMVVLREPVPLRTWFAILVAAGGLIWMSLEGLSSDGLHGMLIALAVPMAGAVNIVVLKSTGARVNLVPAVMLGAVISMIITLPLAWPLTASARDIAILSALGVFQLGLPCILMVRAANHLPPYEVALLGLLEVVLGPMWAWLWAGEQPGTSTLQGGALVLSALLINEVMAQRNKR